MLQIDFHSRITKGITGTSEMRACGSGGAEREGAALLHRAVHLTPGMAAEGGVDLVAEALAGVGPRGEQPDHLHEVVGKVCLLYTSDAADEL